MSFARQPEYFFDRSLGKATAARLRDQGWVIHLIADFYRAEHAMTNASRRHPLGFWHVHAAGRISKMWP